MKRERTLTSEEIVAYLQGRLSPAERARLEHLLASDTSVRQELNELGVVGHALDELRSLEMSLDESVASIVVDRLSEFERAPYSLRRLYISAAGLSAGAIAFAVCITLFERGPSRRVGSQEVLPGAADGHEGGLQTVYNDQRISNSVNALMTYTEGTFGAVVMLVSAISALLVLVRAAITRSRTLLYIGLTLLIASVVMYLSRSLMSTFFNDSLM